MLQITYIDKNKNATDGIANKWTDSNANEVKSIVNGIGSRAILNCGNANLSGGLLPSTGGTGTGGSVEQNNQYYVTVGGSISGTTINAGSALIARIDNPGQSLSNWIVLGMSGGSANSPTVVVDTTASTITLDFNSLSERCFVGSNVITTNKTLAFSNDTNAQLVPYFRFSVTGTPQITLPANCLLPKFQGDNQGIFVPEFEGEYEMYIAKYSNQYRVRVFGPF